MPKKTATVRKSAVTRNWIAYLCEALVTSGAMPTWEAATYLTEHLFGESPNPKLLGTSNAHEITTQFLHRIYHPLVEAASRDVTLPHGAMQHVAEMVSQIARSCQEQVATSKGVMRAVELMKNFTGQVLASTDRQNTVGGVISTSTGQMTDIIQGIRDACQEQTACSEQIVHAMMSVQSSANSNLNSARILERGVESLSVQIDVLRREMAKLQVE